MKPWANRIVGHGEEDPEQLLANPGNWRIHPQFQQDALRGAIKEVGFIRSVTVNRTTGHVVDGHLRVLLAMRAEEKSIPVEYIEISEEEEKLALVTLDPISAMAVADVGTLEALLVDLQTETPAIKQMLEDLAADVGLDQLFEPSTLEEQGQLDEKQMHKCPSCGYEF